MEIKLISDGTGPNTRIVNADTGEEIENITDIKFEISAKDLVSKAVITFVKVGCDLKAEAEESPTVPRY